MAGVAWQPESGEGRRITALVPGAAALHSSSPHPPALQPLCFWLEREVKWKLSLHVNIHIYTKINVYFV